MPKLLLRPWQIENPPNQYNLLGYYWDARLRALRCKKRGVDSFCLQLDLLTLRSNPRGRDAVERVFFGEIDTKGAIARNLLVQQGANSLSEEQRCDFARLLLSLEGRRPAFVEKVRREGTQQLADGLNNDAEIVAAMAKLGMNEAPAEYWTRTTGAHLEDHAVTIIQRLVDNPTVGRRLINAHWSVIHLGPSDGTFVLSDRPLIRVHGYDHQNSTWILPLTPKALFVAANAKSTLSQLRRMTPQRLAKRTNVDSAGQAARFVFAIEESHGRWIGKYLQRKASPIPAN